MLDELFLGHIVNTHSFSLWKNFRYFLLFRSGYKFISTFLFFFNSIFKNLNPVSDCVWCSHCLVYLICQCKGNGEPVEYIRHFSNAFEQLNSKTQRCYFVPLSDLGLHCKFKKMFLKYLEICFYDYWEYLEFFFFIHLKFWLKK